MVVVTLVVICSLMALFRLNFEYRTSKYDYVGDLSEEGLAEVILNGKKGLVGRMGQEVVPPKYYTIWSFSEGLAAVQLVDDNVLAGKWGFVDKTGKEVVPVKYDAVGRRGFSEGLAEVELNGKWGKVDKNGNEYWDMTRDNSTTGETIISKTEEAIIPPKYDEVGYFEGGLAIVKLDGRWGKIDREGKVVIPLKYDELWNLNEASHHRVKLNGKWGFVDEQGNVVLEPKYDEIDDFYKGLAKVRLNDRVFFVDKEGKIDEDSPSWDLPRDPTTGEIIFPPKYDWVGPSIDGFTQVGLNGKRGYIDKQRKVVIPLKYDELWSYHEEDLIKVKRNGKWGFVDPQGNEVVEAKYDSVGEFYKYGTAPSEYVGLVKVKLNDRVFYIDKTGKEQARRLKPW